jgi:hypothetical protein
MNRAAVLCLALVFAVPAHAQSLLDKAPVDVAVGTAVSVTRIGNALAISGKAELVIKQANRTFEALMPAASSQFPCRGGNWIKTVTLSNVSLGQTGWGAADSPIPISVDADAEPCNALLPHLSMRVTVAIAVTGPGKSPYVTAGVPAISPIGFASASVDRFAHARIVDITKKKIDPLVAQINAAIGRFVQRAGMPAGTRATIESIALESDGSALNVRVAFSGQVSTKTASGWLGGI